MIIKVLRGQPELNVTLVEPGLEGRRPKSVEDVRLVITAPPPPKEGSVSKIIRKGSWGYPPVEPPDVDVYPDDPDLLPALVYPAMGLDEEGAVVFRLDRLLWERPCGRYVGRIEAGSGLSATIDLDLNPVKWIIDRVEVGP